MTSEKNVDEVIIAVICREIFKERTHSSNMNDEIKTALSEILKVLEKDKSLYNANLEKGRDKSFSVQDIVNMSFNHVFDNNLNIFGLSKMEALKIQSYFSRYNGINWIYINDLYKEFPSVFQGESRGYIDSVVHLDKTIPLF